MQVLIADDNQVNREFLQGVLERLGAEVTQVSDGKSAVRTALEGRFQLILLDLRMPHLDGLSAAREILQALSPPPRIILISADPRPAHFNEQLTMAEVEWLEKPISASILSQLIGQRHYAEPVGHLRDGDPVLDWQRGLSATGDNEALLRELIQLLANDTGRLLDVLMNPNESLGERQAAAHQLKGAARFCAASELEAACDEVQEALGSERENNALARLQGAAKRLQDAAARL